MSPEKQRTVIAEACGWIKCHECDDGGGCAFWWKHDEDRTGRATHFLPDYLLDLNALQEVEKGLDFDQQEDFINELSAIMGNDDGDSDSYLQWFHQEAFAVAHATASQRAEAFLKTLNLWED